MSTADIVVLTEKSVLDSRYGGIRGPMDSGKRSTLRHKQDFEKIQEIAPRGRAVLNKSAQRLIWPYYIVEVDIPPGYTGLIRVDGCSTIVLCQAPLYCCEPERNRGAWHKTSSTIYSNEAGGGISQQSEFAALYIVHILYSVLHWVQYLYYYDSLYRCYKACSPRIIPLPHGSLPTLTANHNNSSCII